MIFIRDFIIGLRSFWKAILFIREHKLYWYALLPALLMLGIYQLGEIIRTHHFVSNVKTMNGIVWYLIKLLAEISIAMLLMQFTKYLVVTLLSPLLAYLSQKTENIITGNHYPFNLQQFWIDIKRGVKLAIRNMIWQYFFFLVILFFCNLFWEKPQDSVLFYITYLIGFYYYGFSFLDYVNERRRLTMDESILFMRKHRGLTMAIGLGFSMLILVPVNLRALYDWHKITTAPIEVVSQFLVHFFLWICASIAPILTSIAATLAMHEVVDLSANQFLKDVKSTDKIESPTKFSSDNLEKPSDFV